MVCSILSASVRARVHGCHVPVSDQLNPAAPTAYLTVLVAILHLPSRLQGAVAVSGSWLLAVNGGSNTLSLFRISDSDPTSLMLVGSPVDTLGDFPVSVTYSAKCKTACVLNGGKRDGVSCFAVSATGLKPLDASPRPVGLGQSANPPTGPPSTASMIAFNPKVGARVCAQGWVRWSVGGARFRSCSWLHASSWHTPIPACPH